MVKSVPSSPVLSYALGALVKAHQGHLWADPWVSQETGEPGAVSNEPCSAWDVVLTPGTGQSQGEVLGTQVVTARPLSPAWGWAAEDRWPSFNACLSGPADYKEMLLFYQGSPSRPILWTLGIWVQVEGGNAAQPLPSHSSTGATAQGMVLLLAFNKHRN